MVNADGNYYDETRGRIFQLLKKRGISQKELAKELSINPQTVTDWKKGNSNSFAGMLDKLSSALKTTPVWLAFGTGDMDMSDEERERIDNEHLLASFLRTEKSKKETTAILREALARADELMGEPRRNYSSLSYEELFGEFRVLADRLNEHGHKTSLRIPVLGTIPAGIPLEAIEDIHDWEEIPAAWADGGREYFGLQVKGDSMYPQYLEGDTVILRKATTCDSGDDCAVLVNGDEATLKRVFLHEGGAIELRPVNTAYPPRTYSSAEVEALPVQIIGVVVELRRKIK